MRSLELQLENYIVCNLMDYDDIDYMANAALLYKLSGQLIAHLRPTWGKFGIPVKVVISLWVSCWCVYERRSKNSPGSAA